MTPPTHCHHCFAPRPLWVEGEPWCYMCNRSGKHVTGEATWQQPAGARIQRDRVQLPVGEKRKA